MALTKSAHVFALMLLGLPTAAGNIGMPISGYASHTEQGPAPDPVSQAEQDRLLGEQIRKLFIEKKFTPAPLPSPPPPPLVRAPSAPLEKALTQLKKKKRPLQENPLVQMIEKVSKVSKSSKKRAQTQGNVYQTYINPTIYQNYGTQVEHSRDLVQFTPKYDFWYGSILAGASENVTIFSAKDETFPHTIANFNIPYSSSQIKSRFNNILPSFGFNFGRQFDHKNYLTDFNVQALWTPGKNKKTLEIQKFDYENILQEKLRLSVAGGIGRQLTPLLSVFGKLGLAYSSFHFKYTDMGLQMRGSQKLHALGISPGVTFKYQLPSSILLDFHINYTFFKKLKTKNLSPNSKYGYSAIMHPRILTILIGISKQL